MSKVLVLGATGGIGGEVARQLGLRHAPRLEFQIDTALENAQSLTRLIDSAVASDKAAAEQAPAPRGDES